MSGDWIKMRVHLGDHPRVIAISHALLDEPQYLEWATFITGIGAFPSDEKEDQRLFNQAVTVTRYVTVGALLKWWGYANEYAKNERISGIKKRYCDEISGVPGFADALEKTGWAIFEDDGVYLPNFNEFNKVGTDRTNSERQKRFRERNANNGNTVTPLRNAVMPLPEKSREENKENKKKKASKTSISDDWVPASKTTEKLAREFGLRVPEDVDRYVSAFRDACKAKGYRYADFDAAFRNCVRQDWPKLRNGKIASGDAEYFAQFEGAS